MEHLPAKLPLEASAGPAGRNASGALPADPKPDGQRPYELGAPSAGKSMAFGAPRPDLLLRRRVSADLGRADHPRSATGQPAASESRYAVHVSQRSSHGCVLLRWRGPSSLGAPEYLLRLQPRL